MVRTQFRGFGDGDAGSGSFDPGDPGGNPLASAAQDSGTLAELIRAADGRTAALRDVDPITALQSRISAAVPSAYRLPLALGAAGILALVLLPSGSERRRRR